MAKFCKHCGNEIKEGTKFCAKCGTPTGVATSVPSDAWVCPACGHENKKGKFCAKCGGGKPEETATAPAETPIAPVETPAQASEPEATNTPPPPPPTAPVAAPPLPIITEVVPTEAPQNDAFVPSPAQQKTSNKKLPILIAVLVVVAIAAFFGSGTLMDSYYSSKSEECAAVLTESKTLLDNLAELPADAASDDVKKIADGLKKNAEKLDSIRSGLIGKLPKKPQQEKAWNAIGKNAELLSKAAAMVQSQERAFNPASIKRFSALCDECLTKWDEANAAASETTAKNQRLADLIPYADIKKDLQTYRRNKQAFDAKFAQEKYNEHRQERQAAQEELKKMSEVVFLADNAYKNGNDLVVEGRFYNGTPDLVTGVIDMQVDVKLSLWDAEVQNLTDEPCALNLSGLQLAPQQATSAVQLRLQGKAPEGDFNNFEAHVHKIRWSRMKAR